MKRIWTTIGESGQTLVWVALAMVVLLAFVGLAVDGGAAYAERRKMQNAADAGALAGAREYCFGDKANVAAVAQDYATNRNGATTATVGSFEGVPWKVRVTANRDMNTSFMRLLGINTIPVSATAVAACGEATKPCELWPIGYPKPDFHPTHCGEEFLLWGSDNPADSPDLLCGTQCDCDVDDDGVNEYPMDGRTWLDFTNILLGGTSDPCDAPGCSNSELVDRIWGFDKNSGSACFSQISIPSCSSGDSGVKEAWKEPAEMGPKVVKIPLYDPARSYMGANPCSTTGGCGSNLSYWITDAGCMRIKGSFKLDNGPSGNCPGSLEKVILVEVACGSECASECSGTDGRPCEVGDVCAVSLIR